jgi:bacterioferritin (cytochrome b1)
MKGPNGVFDDDQQLINSSPSTSASASQQNSESERQQFNEHVEVHLDMEPEMITSQTESLSFNRQTGELHSNGVINKMVDEEEEIRGELFLQLRCYVCFNNHIK